MKDPFDYIDEALWAIRRRLFLATRSNNDEREPPKLITASTSQSIYKSRDVVQVNLPAESGDMGVLANHVPSIEQLKPGLVEIIEESGSKQFFRMFTENTRVLASHDHMQETNGVME